ncbi:UDP-4-amino-4,6-dideoxy-N-acetyl-beta-L-altrosamine N-acetyltransferase [Oceanobacillus alkalisoli]|uniref:UDP-4-amino-4, 6-dideoxy-N-acetyl-beta-L-altrosamine N-acetyltransferase n=1 Tax=Oceanobacillus alkalisoli TaxID=2925113 RepID=UPI001EE4ACBF|nr:UDP-4-amino-4,6-dideoxy-N-acetyl-beta-L-altrosamine N-acetyltransferase [Oceanobacillus alkalisoli]MCG5102595.1 UDP-4-amino-4,6-dideoxy-N-acetyl-beta-L-altrosamine N-acetyltransferase [Oceanobacillus alkalisoli]
MIRLRKLKSEDKNNILKWRNSPEIAKFMYTDHNITESEHEKWFEKAVVEENGYYWIVEYKGKEMGLASITNIDSLNLRCSTGFYLYKPRARKGIGTFVKYKLLKWCFSELKVEKVYSEHFVFNEAIINLNERLGLKQEGYFRKHALKNNELQDVVYMAILKNEWEENIEKVEEYLENKGIQI